MKNVFTDGVRSISSREEIIRRARAMPPPLVGLEPLSPRAAREQLRRTFSQVFYPGSAVVEVLETCLGRALAHAQAAYPDPATYLAGLYAKTHQPRAQVMTCLTGLAGVGKTALLEALQRVVGPPTIVDLDSNHRSVQLRRVVHHEQGPRLAISDTLNCLIQQCAGPSAETKSDTRRQADQLARLMYAQGVSLLLFDEAQIGTLSSSANAMITKLLLVLRELGVPMIACMNYSLVQRLMQRPSEDRHRLLADPIVLDPPCLEDYAAYLLLLREVAPEAFHPSMNLRVHADWLHEVTAGVPRFTSTLMEIAYEHARRQGRSAFDVGDLKYAHGSDEYSQPREEVEAIHAQHSDPTRPVLYRNRVRADLWNPFRAYRVGPLGSRGLTEERRKELVLTAMAPAQARRFRTMDQLSVAGDSAAREAKGKRKSTAPLTVENVTRSLDELLGRRSTG